MSNDFWIGDIVRVKGMAGTGKYTREVSKSQAIVSIDGHQHLVQKADITVVDDEHDSSLAIQSLVQELSTISQLSKKRRLVPDELDLHMEALDPEHRIHQNRVLTYQVQKAKSYVADAIEMRKRVIKIIHGKGSGLLKAEVRHFLQDIPQVSYIIDKHDGGATEVWLNV